MRFLRRLVLILLVAALVVGALVVFTRRPDLEDARNAVDASWDDAEPALDTRFGLLADANNTVKGTPGPVGQVADDVDESLQDWLHARQDESRDRSIDIANELEGRGRRLVRVVQASPRLSANPEVTAAIDAYAKAAMPTELTRFTAAARAYADEREGPVGSVVAQMFGYDAVSTVAASSAA